jgi:DNA polymerase-4
VGRRRSSVGSQQALGRGARTPDELRTIVVGLVDRVMPRLRAGDRLARTVVLRLRHDDFSRATRSRTVLQATASTDTIRQAALGLLDDATPQIAERGITLLGLAVANLVPADAIQMALPFVGLDGRTTPDTSRLDQALDTLSEKFGSHAVTRAALVGRIPTYEQPTLPG